VKSVIADLRPRVREVWPPMTPSPGSVGCTGLGERSGWLFGPTLRLLLKQRLTA
jgi:hypothetical protein